MTAFSLTRWQQSDRALVLTTLLGADTLLAERMVLRESLFGVAPNCQPQLALREHADWGALDSTGLDAGSVQWLTADADHPPRAGYCLHLTALSADAHLDLVQMIGQPLLLEWQTDADRHTLRPLHGHITAAQLLAVNGGFARYGFVVEPALAWLAQRHDSWVFQGKNILDIVQEVIADTAGTGAMTVREALDKREVYQTQSQRIQPHQSDLDFVHALLLSNGLTYLFEHTADPGGATLGSHTLVITDQQSIGVQLGELRFHRGDATEAQDTIQHWQPQHQIAPLAYSAQSWDYATLDTRPVTVSHDPALAQDNELAAITALLTVEDDPGQYSWFDSADGERYATLAQRAFDARMQTWSGAGTVRSLAPSAHFTLSQRSGSWGSFDAPATDAMAADDNAVRVLAVTHSARNNFDAEFSHLVQQALGGGIQHAEGGAPSNETGNASEAPLYANVFTVVPESVTWRPLALPASSHRAVGAPAPLHARPAPLWSVPVGATRQIGVARATHSGQPRAHTCTAIVVGMDGSPLDTDRNHRIKIQYHWQRGQSAHNRQSHPSGDSNAPTNDTSSTWARIGTPLAGHNYGAVWIPRIGQEVVVAFAHGDMDRPVIVGAVYNGEGTPDQTGNTQPGGVGAATGNAPLWFNGNGHANHLSGIVTQTLSDSQSGAAQRYNQLVLDDTPQQSRLELFTTQAETQLQLGHHQHQVHNERRADLGHGLTASTQQYGALRAGSGLLLSADGKADTASTLDSAEPLAQLAEAESLLTTLAKSAQDHEAKLAAEPAPDKLPVTAQLKHSQEILNTTQSATQQAAAAADADAIRKTGGGAGTVAAWSAPALTLSAPDGIAWVTPQSTQVFANGNLTTVAQDIEQGAQGNLQHISHGGTVLFTYGKAQDTSKVVCDTGIRLHAATGQTHLQAHSGKIDMHADKTVTVASHTRITADTPTKILLAAGGSAITIQGGQIVLQSAGAINLMGNPKSHTTPAGAGAKVDGLGKGVTTTKQLLRERINEQFEIINEENGQPEPMIPYKIVDEAGKLLAAGHTDHMGRTARVSTPGVKGIRLLLDE